MNIHATAIVDPKAKIAAGVEIGPYSVVGPDVQVGENTRIHSHVVLDGWTKIGANCDIFQFASVGVASQDLKYRGEECYVEIGDNTIIRECVTVNRGTVGGGRHTRVGNDCLIMACAHVAHDCIVGNNVIMANAVLLAGHVTIDDYAIVGGASAVHQYVHVGKHSMIGGCCKITSDVLPYCLLGGSPTYVAGLNIVGLKRHGINMENIRLLKQAYRLIYRSGLSRQDAVQQIEQLEQVTEIREFLDGIERAERGIMPDKTKLRE